MPSIAYTEGLLDSRHPRDYDTNDCNDQLEGVFPGVKYASREACLENINAFLA